MNKDELIKAAETLKKYCDEHNGYGCRLYESDCLFSEICSELQCAHYNLGKAMKDIAHEVKYFDG